MAAALVDIDGLGDLLGERHRIIANDWLAANMRLIATLLDRAADILDQVDFTPAALRADLAGPAERRAAPLGRRARQPCRRPLQRLRRLVNDNERRWRVFRERVATIVESSGREDAPVRSEET